DAYRETATVQAGFKVEDAEHLHAVLRDGVLVTHHADVSEAQGFNQASDDLVVRHGPVGQGSFRRGDGGEFRAGELAASAVGDELRWFHRVNPPLCFQRAV